MMITITSVFGPEGRAMASVFAPLGWAFFGMWHLEESRRICRLAKNGVGDATIDEAVTTMWNEMPPALLRSIAGPLGRYGRNIDHDFQRRCQLRQTLMYEAVDSHLDGKYGAAITLTLSQIDGLVQEIVGTTFFKAKPGDTEMDYVDDETLAGIDGNLSVVRAAFSEPIDDVGRHGAVSRHGVMHGKDLTFNTRVNSTKTLVLMGALVERLEARSANRARKWKRDHELAVRKLTGVDATGRLLDDRGLDAVSTFRMEFHTKAFNEIVFNGGLLSGRVEEVATALLSERGLRVHEFDLSVVEVDRMMWTFHLPSGHYLASAMAIPDRAKFPIVELKWSWDSSSVPEHAPWVDVEGWEEVDDLPTSPNWTFAPYYT